jgi:hypothetical protein
MSLAVLVKREILLLLYVVPLPIWLFSERLVFEQNSNLILDDDYGDDYDDDDDDNNLTSCHHSL